METIRGLMGVKKDSRNVRLEERSYPEGLADLPTDFDSRTNWPQCPVIGQVYDQGACGNCWAVASTGVMNDRTCIKSNGAVNFRHSAIYLTSCCKTCGMGCKGLLIDFN
jgi:cathepsin B